MPLTVFDAILVQQALIVGAMHDALTGRPPLQAPTVTLWYQTPPGAPQRLYPLTARVDASGRFTFVGNPTSALPRLAMGEELALRLTASAAGYETAQADFTLTAAALQPTARTVEIDGRAVTIALPNVPLIQHQFALQPLPVHLGGRVVDADNRATPIQNAQVRVTAPALRGPVTTDVDGFFTLHNLPVALAMTVQVTHADFPPLETVITLDYSQPVHQQVFALSSS
jgi:hypothetical protein